MGKQLRFNLSDPKTKKYVQYNKCVCYNLTKQFGNGNLYVVFLPDELNGITINNTNCSVKNCKNILQQYFNKVEIKNKTKWKQELKNY